MLFLDIVDPTFSYFAPWIVLCIAVVSAVFVLMLPYLVHNLVLFIKAKTGIVVTQDQQNMFISLADSVVLQVEQWARNKLKLGEEAPDGAKKLEKATEKLEKRLKDEGLYDKFADFIEDQIEASVAKMNGPITAKEKDEIKAALPADIEVDADADEKPKKKIGEK